MKHFCILLLCILSITSSAIEYTTTNELNVRKNAGIEFNTIGILNKNEAIDVIEINDGWAKINYNNEIGYINTKYISINSNTHSKPIKSSILYIAIVLIIFYLLRKTVVGQYLAPELSRLFGSFDKTKSKRQYHKYRCRACGEIRGSYFFPEYHNCKSSKTHDWRKIT